jgi:hypothetical protein
LSSNQNAIELLSANLDKVNWYNLTMNPSAANLIAKHKSKIDWESVCYSMSWIEKVDN